MPKRPSEPQLQHFANLIKGKTRAYSDSTLTTTNPDKQELVKQLDYHGITLLALHCGTLPPDVVKQIDGRKAMMVANETLKQTALTELFDAFEQAGLKNSILFKGSALAYTVYPEPWLRPRSDSDCLIDQSDYQQFSKVFNELGYQKLFAIEGKHISYQSTFSKALVGQATLSIDLHWRINNRQTLANTFDVHELIESSQHLLQLSNAIKIPSTINSILIASLHRLGHHQNEERITWLYDIYLLANTLSDNDWRHLCNKAGDKKIAAITLNALKYCQRLFDMEIPRDAEQTLIDLAAKDEPSQLFLDRDLPEWRYFVHDLKGLTGWRNKLGLMFENIFPNPSYVRQQMGTKNTALAYLKRMIRGLQRITR